MVHLGALPGAPGFSGDLDRLIADAVSDAATLARAGFEAVMVENFGDAPFFADDVPKVTVAAMTAAVGAVASAVDLPVGVNVLRNDAAAALAVAAVTGAAMIRVNVLSGTMYTDQGPIVGRAAEVARLRSALCPQVALLADVMVKHATPPPGLTLEQATADVAERSGADAIVVSGSGTGAPASLEDVVAASNAGRGLPVYLGSGVTADTVGEFLSVADGVIVGTSVKRDGWTTNPVDEALAKALVAAATR
jgi:membrane complex biogenesis BtpA family protein